MGRKKKSESIIRDIKRQTRRKFSSEEKISIVIEGLRGEDSVASICRKEGISPTLYYRWSKDFMEAGKRRLQGDTVREANSTEVDDLKAQNRSLKIAVADLTLEAMSWKKKLNGAE
jgi:transposase